MSQLLFGFVTFRNFYSEQNVLVYETVSKPKSYDDLNERKKWYPYAKPAVGQLWRSKSSVPMEKKFLPNFVYGNF